MKLLSTCASLTLVAGLLLGLSACGSEPEQPQQQDTKSPAETVHDQAKELQGN